MVNLARGVNKYWRAAWKPTMASGGNKFWRVVGTNIGAPHVARALTPTLALTLTLTLTRTLALTMCAVPGGWTCVWSQGGGHVCSCGPRGVDG